MPTFDPISSLVLDKVPRQELSKSQKDKLSKSLKGYIVAIYSKKGYTYLWYTRSPERLLQYMENREGDTLELIASIPSKNTREDIRRLYKIFEKRDGGKAFWFNLNENDLSMLRSFFGE